MKRLVVREGDRGADRSAPRLAAVTPSAADADAVVALRTSACTGDPVVGLDVVALGAGRLVVVDATVVRQLGVPRRLLHVVPSLRFTACGHRLIRWNRVNTEHNQQGRMASAGGFSVVTGSLVPSRGLAARAVTRAAVFSRLAAA